MQKLPFTSAGLILSLLVLGAGIFLLRKKEKEQATGWLLILCSFAFLVAFIIIGSVVMAALLPFIDRQD